MLGIKIWISLTTNLPLPCITLVKAKIALYVGIAEELIRQEPHTCARAHTHTHTHTHTQTFPFLPTACLQPPSCQHDPSAPPQNQTLLIETWWQSGRCGSHVSYWWFMSSYRGASLIKRSNCPAHRPSHTPKVLVKHISFPVQCGICKTATHSNWQAWAREESWEAHRALWFSWSSGDCGWCLCVRVWVCACVCRGFWSCNPARIPGSVPHNHTETLPWVLTAPPILPTGFSLCSKSTNYFL